MNGSRRFCHRGGRNRGGWSRCGRRSGDWRMARCGCGLSNDTGGRRRCGGDGRARFGCRSGGRSNGRPCNNRPGRGLGRNGRGLRRRGNNRRGLTGLRNDPAWGGFGCFRRGSCRRCGSCLTSRGGHRCDGLCGSGWYRSWRCGARRRGGGFLLLLLQDGLQHIARFGDVRQIDLGLGRSFGARSARCSGLAALQICAHTISLVILKRAGVRFLLGDSYSIENIKNRLALDFQFTRQIIDSNFTHPSLCPCFPSPLASHCELLAVGYAPVAIMARNSAICARYRMPIGCRAAHLLAAL